ncbi:hypothetical protein NHQ30_009124 [Ciborinia camelliae]|nr:hypothetical protein NHQ30_009124 [Ciborinia camelliae]
MEKGETHSKLRVVVCDAFIHVQRRVDQVTGRVRTQTREIWSARLATALAEETTSSSVSTINRMGIDDGE